MKCNALGLASLAVLLAAPGTFAQTGTLDQVSPFGNAWYNIGPPILTWQQQVRVGVGGQLEGFQLTFSGNAGAYCDLFLRVGDGWNIGPVVWMGSYTKAITGNELAFFDVTSASIQLTVGDTFVIETHGNDTGMGLIGSYVDPTMGPALYPENLYLNGPGCYAGCGWRHGFETWMLTGLGTNYCISTPNSTGAAATISASGSGSVSANDLVLTANSLPSQPGIFIAGPNSAQIPFFNGFLCIDPIGLQRFSNTAAAAGGMITEAVDIATSAPGGLNVMAGSSYFFQRWNRDPAGGGLNANFSDGIEIVYTP
ncbi:MAG: hypothetical protein E2O39_17240 [Planctomycetota bacterium]|nr:MAG: hypothetical protein E2O39_17240 [Planctomycetota bacterium]